MTLVKRALLAAVEAHKGQTRKGGGPYVEHPMRVAGLVKLDTNDEEVIAAAYLHDVVEDTDYDLSGFPARVLELVELLTKTRKMSKVDAVKKVAYDPDAVLIKMADRVDNLTDENSFSSSYAARKSVQESTRLIAAAAEAYGLHETHTYGRLSEVFLEILKNEADR